MQHPFICYGLLFSLLTFGVKARGQGQLLALSKDDDALAIVDPESQTAFAMTLPGHTPLQVVASNDGRTAYISSYGAGTSGEIMVFDLVTHRPAGTLDVSALAGPYGITFRSGDLWFTAEAAATVARFDPQTRKVELIHGTGQNRSRMIYVAPDARRIITLAGNTATLIFLEREPSPRVRPRPVPNIMLGGTVQDPSVPQPRTEQSGSTLVGTPKWTESVVPIGTGNASFDVSPNGAEIWIASPKTGTISIVDGASKSVIATFPSHVTNLSHLKFTPDGTRVLVSGLDSPEVAIFDAQTKQLSKHILIGQGAAGILMQPNGNRAYVACPQNGYVAIIDLASLTVTAKIRLTVAPDELAWASAIAR